MLLGLLLARRVRREGAVTLPEIVGRYYGGPARRVAAVLVLASEIVWFALLTEATQVVLTAAFGIRPVAAIVLSTAVFADSRAWPSGRAVGTAIGADPGAAPARAAYWLTRSSVVMARSRGTARTSRTSRPSPSAPSPAYIIQPPEEATSGVIA